MTVHAVCYQCLNNRETAQYGQHPFRSYKRQVTLLPTQLTTPILFGPVQDGIIPLSAWTGNAVTSAVTPIRRVWGRVTTDGPAFAILEAVDGFDFASVDGVHTDNAVNVMQRSASLTVGRQNRPVVIVFGGAVFTALATLAGTVTGFDGQVDIAYPENLTYTNWSHFIEFEDRPPDTAASGAARNQSLFRSISSASSRFLLGVTSGGVSTYVSDCNFAAGLPEGRYFVRPEDIGANEEQIPSAIADNTAEHFRFHPGVFLRRHDYVSGLTRMNADPVAIEDAQDASGQPFRITSITSAPTSSDWFLIIDSQPVIIRLVHPAGSDHRRPRDIWNQVWVPLLQGSQSVANAVQYASIDGIQTASSSILDRLRYLQYARVLEIQGNQTDIPQSGLG